MAIGENSPIIDALSIAESTLGTVVRVHLNRRRWDANPLQSAWRIFNGNRLSQIPMSVGILFYFNLRTHQFAVVSDSDWKDLLNPLDWNLERHRLQREFSETNLENAIARMVKRIAEQLKPRHSERNESLF